MSTRTQYELHTKDIEAFVATVAEQGALLYRDFPWRHTQDPYAILLSEVMLQQTQVTRVVRYYNAWLADYPTFEALAAAPLEAVLRSWQGLGYNRRCIALKRLAEKVSEEFGGRLPVDEKELLALPGIGPATAAGVRAFAFDQPGTYLETNVRAVVLHELFADEDGIADSRIRPIVAQAAACAAACGISPRAWNYALLDYGAYLKRTVPNPSRRSAHHTRQSTFEGSTRQKRAWLLRAVLDDSGRTAEAYAAMLVEHERSAGRSAPTISEAVDIVEALAAEGFLVRRGERLVID